jgi:hypothetical protein
MSCCGQKRAALRTRARTPRLSEPSPVKPPPEPHRGSGASVDVEYAGDRAVLARGKSGRLYTFSPGRRTRRVSAPDAERLLRNPLFRLDERRFDGTRTEGS